MKPALVLVAILSATALHAQRLVFDAHLHAQSSEKNVEAMKAAMEQMNVRGAVSITSESGLKKTPAGLLPALMFPCEDGRMPNAGIPCFENGKAFPDLARLREQVQSGEVRVFGELANQYAGIAPDDPRLEPYFALAEELDVPVGIHMGIGPPGVAYPLPGFPARKSPNYRGAAGSPLALETVLTRHPKMRLYVMHAAWPMLDDMLYMLYMHPQLYADISVLQYAIPRAEYYRYLKTLVEAGFASRLLFGSDGGAKHLIEGVKAIEDAPFLSEDQKSAILYGNAAKFFKLVDRTP